MRKNIATISCLFSLTCLCLAAPAMSASHSKGAANADIALHPDTMQVWSGNVKSRKFHNSSCKHFACKTCTAHFKSREAAQKAGYAPCGKCGG